MDKERLKKLTYLKRESVRLKERLLELESLAQSITQTLTDMPVGGNSADRMAEVVSKIIDVQKLIEENRLSIVSEELELTSYIESIKDVLVKQILYYRYDQGYKWEEVAEEIGGGNSASSCRMLVERYQQKYEKEI